MDAARELDDSEPLHEDDDAEFAAWLDGVPVPENEPSGLSLIEGEQEDGDDEEDVDDDDDDDAPTTQASAPIAPSYPDPPCTLIVAQGDCVLSIAARYRMSPDQIWNAGPNAELRRVRDPNVLHPGDELHIPAREERTVEVQTSRRHRFRLSPAREIKFVLRLLEEGKPRAGIAYELAVDGTIHAGETDGAGRIEAPIAKSARKGTLTLFEGTRARRIHVRFGALDPIEETTGVQARLAHLGHYEGAIDGVIGAALARALRRFQRARKLSVTGELDGATKRELETVHGS
jgi:hypothetical protein